MKKVPGMRERFGLNACCIAGGGLYKGAARFVGMKVLKVKGATGTPKTDIRAKISRALRELKKYSYAFVHIKGCDVFGHDGNAKGKKEFIERIDRAFKPLPKLKNALIVITADHSTPCSHKDHSAHPVPVLFFGSWVKADSVKEFGERACRKGTLGAMQGKGLVKKMLKEARKSAR